MITSSVHTVSTYLTKSLHDYRAQLDRQDIKAQTTEPIRENTEIPATPVGESVPPVIVNLDANQIQEDAQERRDKARQTSVHAVEIKQTQMLVDTYISASSEADDSNSNTSTIEPYDVYTTSLKYARRADLMSAFEEATKPQGPGMVINVVV